VNIVLILRIYSVKVSKIQVEREGGVGDWRVTPSIEESQNPDAPREAYFGRTLGAK
jgi:hypothetical protein